jgi:hypothetical protein
MKPPQLSSTAVAAILICFGSGDLAGQDSSRDSLTSGPAAGAKLTPVPSYATGGPFAGQEFDAAAKLGPAPGALLFIHELTRNTAPVLRGLDNLAVEFSIVGFKSFTIMLGEDRTAAEAQLGRVNGSLKLANPIVLSTDGAEGPGNYALNRKSALTLVLTKDGTVHRSIALTDTGPGDIPKIRSWIEEVAGALPEDEGELRELIAKKLPDDTDELKQLAASQSMELRKLRAQLAKARQQPGRPMAAGRMRERAGGDRDAPTRPKAKPAPNPNRVGRPPEDPQLNTLLRSFIRQTNDTQRADEVYADIEARAAESDDLRAEAIEMFKLMLSFRDRYGIAHAQGLAEGFLKENKIPIPGVESAVKPTEPGGAEPPPPAPKEEE